MSLLDALLLEPYRVNIWVAVRTDGIAGSGTLRDPYDGSDPDVFDDLMNSFAAQVTETTGVRVNLGPGIFETDGFFDGESEIGWQPASRMKIVGSGIDVTQLKLVSSAANGDQCFAVGHALGDDPIDFFEISDLTIDCDLSNQANAVAAGAIRIKGNHFELSRLLPHWLSF